MITENWNIDENIQVNYINACTRAINDNSKFLNFKKDPSYRVMLEHTPEESGHVYFNKIKNNPYIMDNIEKFKQNDLVGGSSPLYFDNILISSSTLRYVNVLDDIVKKFKTLDDLNIVEIGGGYGGQCLILSKIFNWKKYTILDLPEPAALAKKYLALNKVLNIETNIIPKKIDFVISNYAFSELSKPIQQYYIDKVINPSTMGYMTINYINYGLNCFTETELKTNINKPITSESDISNNNIHNNKVYTWGSNVS
jgi:hypothetical protein